MPNPTPFSDNDVNLFIWFSFSSGMVLFLLSFYMLINDKFKSLSFSLIIIAAMVESFCYFNDSAGFYLITEATSFWQWQEYIAKMEQWHWLFPILKEYRWRKSP